MNFKKITNQEEYKDLVEKLSFLVDKELEKFELIATGSDLYAIAEHLPKLISLVNTIGYLRGQDNAFLEVRPHVDFQKDLYANEDAFEARLYKLIDLVNKSTEAKHYKERMKAYFLSSRNATLE